MVCVCFLFPPPPQALAFARARAARKCQRAWRAFSARQGSTAALARSFAKCGISLAHARAEAFDPFAERLQANSTLRAVQRLLRRVGARLDRLGRPRGPTEHLLARLRPAAAAGGAAAESERFPPRVLLCAYMISSHADVVLGAGRNSAQQAPLCEAAEALAASLDSLVPSFTRAAAETAAADTDGKARQLAFASAWERYLDQFVAWKTADAAAIERDITRMACKMVASAARKCGAAVCGEAPLDRPDREAIRKQLVVDADIMRSRVACLSGPQGAARFDAALDAARAAAVTESEATSTAASSASASESESEGAAAASGASGGASRAAGSVRRGFFDTAPRTPDRAKSSAAASPPVPSSPPQTAGASPARASGGAPGASGGGARSAGLSSPDSVSSSSTTRSAFRFPTAKPAAASPAAAVAAAQPPPAAQQRPAPPPQPQPQQPQQRAWVPTQNERIMHQLLHDPSVQPFRVPEPVDPFGSDDEASRSDGDDDAAGADPQRLEMRVRRTMERAFWDFVRQGLASDPPDCSRVMQLFAEVRDEVLAISPAPRRADLAEHFDLERTRAALTSLHRTPAAAAGQLAALLVAAAGVVGEASGGGKEAREVSARLERLLEELGEGTALAEREAGAGRAEQARQAMAAVVARALRFTFAQLQAVKAREANAHMRDLVRLASGPAGPRWAAERFAERMGLASGRPLAELLPRTKAFVEAASGRARDVLRAELADAMAQRGLPDAGIPALLQSGLRAPPGGAGAARAQGSLLSSSPSAAAAAAAGGLAACSPSRSELLGSAGGASGGGAAGAPLRGVAQLHSWQALLRVGLIEAAAEPNPAPPEQLPETLVLDAQRLFHAQNDLQRALVLACCMLLLGQVAAQGATTGAASPAAAPRPPLPPPQVVKQRVSALLADPEVRIPAIAAELAHLAGSTDEQLLVAMLGRMTSTSDPTYRAICAALCRGLRSHMLLGGAAGASRAAAALQRCGAAALAPELEAVARALEAVAVVGERVHGATYAALAAEAMQEQQGGGGEAAAAAAATPTSS